MGAVFGSQYSAGALFAPQYSAGPSGDAAASGAIAQISLVAPIATAHGSNLTAYWPTPDQVLSGIAYGPTGADYTGTATGGSGPTAADIAAAVWSYTQ